MTTLYNLYDFINYIERSKENEKVASKKQKIDHNNKSSPNSNTPTTSSTTTATPKYKYQQPIPSYDPNVDIYETKDTVYIELEAPGIEKSDFNIDWNSNTSKLIISGVRKNKISQLNNDNNNSKLLVNELEHGSFKREIKLNSNLIDLTTINANLVDGVLFIKISKKPQNTLNIKVNIQ
ncbi:hypothetical protein CYY_003807 [Polysphondylium violaceum]|uniref:SHSP domain-containing protein n=1 Tax=Polysphondylium violaceum TaxID=133409 RepID=A0A8J4PVP3_9MYCE|nr:hypothetical protein CYY_003807 [Polysphondylium violaceum]